MDDKNIPEIILRIRRRSHFSQGALAEVLGVSVSTVSAWETGDRVPKRVNWAHIQKLFPWIDDEGSEIQKRENNHDAVA